LNYDIGWVLEMRFCDGKIVFLNLVKEWYKFDEDFFRISSVINISELLTSKRSKEDNKFKSEIEKQFFFLEFLMLHNCMGLPLLGET
jgi:hypothetical protein